MKTELLPHSRIAVTQKQLHGNASVVTTGEFIIATGNMATVLLEGEAVVREVPIDSIGAADELIGNLSSRPGEQPIIDMTPRR